VKAILIEFGPLLPRVIEEPVLFSRHWRVLPAFELGRFRFRGMIVYLADRSVAAHCREQRERNAALTRRLVAVNDGMRNVLPLLRGGE
jgi:hypothetical protein